jgi:hypothetical protein
MEGRGEGERRGQVVSQGAWLPDAAWLSTALTKHSALGIPRAPTSGQMPNQATNHSMRSTQQAQLAQHAQRPHLR